jgi:molybdopterin-guanine dinucleotide biosynthesis protein A
MTEARHRGAEFAGFVLVGGAGRRMGGDKALLPFEGVPLAHRLAERVGSAAGSATLVGSRRLYAALGWPIIEDLFPGRGPLAGIHSVLKQSAAEWSLVVACDLPFLGIDFLRFMLRAATEASAEGAQLVVPVSSRGYELAAVLRRDCLPAAEAAVAGGDYRLSGFYARVPRREIAPVEWRRFDPDGLLFQNVNAPEDVKKLRVMNYEL